MSMNLPRTAALGLVLAALAAMPASAADPLTVSVKRLSMETAVRIAQAAVEACRAEGVQDERCAMAGLDAVRDDLEMAGL
jgi:hypothetical protein